MDLTKTMKLKQPEEIIKSFSKKYLKKEDNIIFLERLFMAASVIRWSFSRTKNVEEIMQYLTQVERYMEGEIDLYWEEGIIKLGKNKRGN